MNPDNVGYSETNANGEKLTYQIVFVGVDKPLEIAGFKRLVNEKDQKIYIWTDENDRRKQAVIPLANVLYWTVN